MSIKNWLNSRSQRTNENMVENAAQSAEAQVGAGQPIPDENEGLPSVNARGSSKLGRRIGALAMIVFAGWMLWAINKPSKPAAAKDPEKELVASSYMPPLSAPVQRAAPSLPAQQSKPPLNPGGPQTAAPATNANRSKHLEWYERKRTGKGGVTGASSAGASTAKQDEARRPTTNEGQTGQGGMAAKLAVTPISGVSASVLGNRNFLITQGNGIDCTLETALESTHPGVTTCVGAGDIYSANRLVKLLPAGTRYVGEYQGGLRGGQSRVFLVWTRAETPSGVVINLNSPSTDALGRSGAEGWVDHHFAERFGAAFLSTILSSSLDYAIAGREKGASTVIGDSAQSGSRVAEKILDNTINIPPTLHKNQGDEIRIMVARDLDFSTVYSLRMR